MRVLCAIDGSRYSRWTLELLRALPDSRRSTVHLVYAVNADVFRATAGPGIRAWTVVRRAIALARFSGRTLLTRAARVVAGRVGAVRTSMMTGRPARTILRAATTGRADLLVVGSRGLTLDHLSLLGSVSHAVVRNAPSPVLVIKRPVTGFRRIVVASDGSADARAAAAFMGRLVRPDLARITVVTVVPPVPFEVMQRRGRMPESVMELRDTLTLEAGRIAEAEVGHLHEAGFRGIPKVTRGHVAEQIIRTAVAAKADLVVIGARGGARGQTHPLGSVSDVVVTHAPCAVLVRRKHR